MPTFDPPHSPRPAIRDNPLPQAAESLQDQLIDQLFGKGLLWLTFIIATTLFAALEWINYFSPATLGVAIFYSACALIFAIFAGLKVRRAFRQAKILKQGIRGEIHISQYLAQLCVPLGYRLFNDISAAGTTGTFNIDHLLIGPAGIFSLETKNWSLPPAKTGRAEITVNADTLQKSDGTFDKAAIPQARNNADYIRQLLAKLTARPPHSLYIRPVLLLPGWFINRSGHFWIFGNNTLHQFLENEPTRLPKSDIALLSESLTTHIRNTNH